MTTVSSKPWPTFAAAVELRSEMTTPASAGDRARQREQDQLDALDAQAREVRRLLVGADREDRAAERRRVQQHANATASSANSTIVFGTNVPAKFPNARSVQVAGKSVTDSSPMTTKASPRNSASVPIVTASDGRPRRVTSRPLNAPHSAPASDADRDDRLDRLAVVPQVGHQRARQREHRGDREVDLGRDDHHRQRQRHQRDLRQVERAGGERVGREELGRDRLAGDRRDHQQPDEQRLPAAEHAPPVARRRRGGRGGAVSGAAAQSARRALLRRRAASTRTASSRSSAIASSSSAPIAACCQNASTRRTISDDVIVPSSSAPSAAP